MESASLLIIIYGNFCYCSRNVQDIAVMRETKGRNEALWVFILGINLRASEAMASKSSIYWGKGF